MINSAVLSRYKGDIFGGLTAAVVALPLALAFGVASGAGALAGLYGAIFVGFFAAIFGGTATQISGPTGPMTVVMAMGIAQFAGNLPLAFFCVTLAGLFQIGFGVLGFGRYIKLVPQPVISGFMSGIGVIVIILEVGHMLGHEPPSGGTLVKLAAMGDMLGDINWQAVSLCFITLVIGFFTPQKIRTFIPPALLAIIVGTLLGVFVFSEAPVIGHIPSGLPELALPSMQLNDVAPVIKFALILAFLGSIDSLLTSLVADSLTRTHHNSDKELVGQGIGNFFAGIVGGLPGAGATMRTMVNIRTGGQTWRSGALHAVVLLAIVLVFSDLAGLVPKAVLAGILFKVGIEIIDWQYLKRLHKVPTAGVVIMLSTLGITVFVDLILAVAIGVTAACFIYVVRSSEAQVRDLKSVSSSQDVSSDQAVMLTEEEESILDSAGGRIVIFEIEGPLSFGSARDVARILQANSKPDVLVLDLSFVPFIDGSASYSLEQVIVQLREVGDEVVIAGARERVNALLQKTGLIDLLGRAHSLPTRIEALRFAQAKLTDIEK